MTSVTMSTRVVAASATRATRTTRRCASVTRRAVFGARRASTRARATNGDGERRMKAQELKRALVDAVRATLERTNVDARCARCARSWRRDDATDGLTTTRAIERSID